MLQIQIKMTHGVILSCYYYYCLLLLLQQELQVLTLLLALFTFHIYTFPFRRQYTRLHGLVSADGAQRPWIQ